MTIGLYDIELWHRGKAMPNLELMKVFNYHFQQNDMVKMMRPGEDEGRYNKIIYFKDNPDTQIARSLNLTGPKKEIYGYGFFKGFYPLDNIYTDVPPSYLCYEPYTEKFSKDTYERFKKSSFVRYENMDMSDYKKEKTILSIADHNFMYMDGAADFLQKYKNHRFNFSHRLEIKDEETFLKFIPYVSLSYRRFFINYHFSKEVFTEYFKERIVFNWSAPFDGETEEERIIRYITMILYHKVNKKAISVDNIPTTENMLKYVLQWGRTNNQQSYYEYYSNNKQAIKLANESPYSIRLLLKSKPSKMDSSDVDFTGVL